MTAMQEFTVWMLGAVADFLAAEPIFYFYALILFCFVLKGIKTFIF